MLPSYLPRGRGWHRCRMFPIVDHGNLFRHGLQGLMPVIGKRGVAPKPCCRYLARRSGLSFIVTLIVYLYSLFLGGC